MSSIHDEETIVAKHYMNRVKRFYIQHCEPQEHWLPMTSSHPYDNESKIFMIVFKGHAEDAANILQMLDDRPML